MIDEVQLFIDGIKPAILIDDDVCRKNIRKLNNFKICKTFDEFLIYRDESYLKDKQLREVLGYPPMCVNKFEEERGKILSKEKIVSSFLNYNGIYFNCFDLYNEALEWCHRTYKKKMLQIYGRLEITYETTLFERDTTGQRIWNERVLESKFLEVRN